MFEKFMQNHLTCFKDETTSKLLHVQIFAIQKMPKSFLALYRTFKFWNKNAFKLHNQANK